MAGLFGGGGGASVLVKFLADTSQVTSAAGQVEGAGGRMSSIFKNMSKVVGPALAVGAIVKFGSSAVQAAQESEVATARLSQVFKSMGDETGTAAIAAEKYASSLSRKIGVEDEAIMQSQALLATFSNVSNEAARQAGVFDRATAAAADLSATGFGSMDSSAKMLGKALQDPVKGLTALGKAGVTFTAQQKEQIAAMVASGDVLGAQAIIMGEVEKQVGGVAEATATGSSKMNIAIGEMSESIGMALLPVIEKITPIVGQLADFIAKNSTVFAVLVGVVIALAAAITVMNVALAVTAVVTSPITLIILAIVVGIVALIAVVILLRRNWDTIWAAVVKGWNAIKDAAAAAWGFVSDNWPKLVALLGPVGIAIVLIATNFDKVKAAAQIVADFFRGALKVAMDTAKGAMAALSGVISAIAGAFDTAASAAGRLVDAIKSIPSKISLPSLPDLNPFSRAIAAAPAAMAGPTAMAAGVSPQALQRQTASRAGPIQVNVYIGNEPLRGIVRSTVSDVNTGIARTLLAGAR